MGHDLLALAAGLVLLVLGGDGLVRGASSLARRLGVRPVLIGLTVVAFGTSAPELAVSLTAALDRSPGIAFGNVVGSNVANLGLILGATALVRPLEVRGSLIAREIPMMVLASAAALALAVAPDLDAWDGRLDRAAGLVLLLFFAVFLYASVGDALRERQRDPLGQQAQASPLARGPGGLPALLALIAGGLVGLTLGGRLLVGAATSLALSLGVPEAVVGLSIVAVGTSLPELVTSLVAALRGEADLALGNVVGSNVFNLLLVLPAAALVRPFDVPAGGGLDLALALLLALVLFPLARSQRRLGRGEGLVLLAAWAAYVAWRAA